MDKMTSAKNLVTPNRFDLPVKYKYVEFFDKKMDLPFIKEYYLKFIEAFSDGKFTEEDGTDRKHGKQDFIDSFEELIISIHKNGYELERESIPVSDSGDIVNGAHRTAIAAYYDIDVPTCKTNSKSCYNYAYFQKKLLDQYVMDYSALVYTTLKDNLFLACIWPRTEIKLKQNEIESLFKKYGKVVYVKKIFFSLNALTYFVAQIYAQQPWVGNIENHFQGAAQKALNCYKKGNPLIGVLFEADDIEQVKRLKEEFRSMFSLGNHSIHITDNSSETRLIANILFNNNSIDILNRGEPWKYKKLYHKVEEYKEKIGKCGFNAEDFVIDSSTILGLYGLRSVGDLDFISVDQDAKVIENEYIGNHSHYIKYYDKSIMELIYDPQNYFVFNGVKFVTLDLVKKFKQTRGEKKDLQDVQLINEFQKRECNRLRMFYLKMRGTIKKEIRSIKIAFIHFVKKILVAMGIFEKVKKYIKGS